MRKSLNSGSALVYLASFRSGSVKEPGNNIHGHRKEGENRKHNKRHLVTTQNVLTSITLTVSQSKFIKAGI